MAKQVNDGKLTITLPLSSKTSSSYSKAESAECGSTHLKSQ